MRNGLMWNEVCENVELIMKELKTEIIILTA